MGEKKSSIHRCSLGAKPDRERERERDVLIGDRWILFTAMVTFSSVLQDSEMYLQPGDAPMGCAVWKRISEILH